jgi:Pyruvate/2-oxoacid:ferredoxin oxidoreductase delta subunit
MKKKVIIISSSPRRHENSDILCDQFASGALDAGHQVEKIFLGDQVVSYCTGCGVCFSDGKVCSQEDDMAEILEKTIAADVIVMATPVYSYMMAAQMKTLIDRTCSRYQEISNKEFFPERGNEFIGLGDGALHVTDQFVHIRLHADHFVTQPGDRPGVEVVLHEQDLVAQGHQSRLEFGLGPLHRLDQFLVFPLRDVVLPLALPAQAVAGVLLDFGAPFAEQGLGDILDRIDAVTDIGVPQPRSSSASY